MCFILNTTAGSRKAQTGSNLQRRCCKTHTHTHTASETLNNRYGEVTDVSAENQWRDRWCGVRLYYHCLSSLSVSHTHTHCELRWSLRSVISASRVSCCCQRLLVEESEESLVSLLSSHESRGAAGSSWGHGPPAYRKDTFYGRITCGDVSKRSWEMKFMSFRVVTLLISLKHASRWTEGLHKNIVLPFFHHDVPNPMDFHSSVEDERELVWLQWLLNTSARNIQEWDEWLLYCCLLETVKIIFITHFKNALRNKFHIFIHCVLIFWHALTKYTYFDLLTNILKHM